MGGVGRRSLRLAQFAALLLAAPLFATKGGDSLQWVPPEREAGVYAAPRYEGFPQEAGGVAASPARLPASSAADFAAPPPSFALGLDVEEEFPFADAAHRAARQAEEEARREVAVRSQRRELSSLIEELLQISKKRAGSIRGLKRIIFGYMLGVLSGAVFSLGFVLVGFCDLLASLWERRKERLRAEGEIQRLVDLQRREHSDPVLRGRSDAAVKYARQLLEVYKREPLPLRGAGGLVLASAAVLLYSAIASTPFWPLPKLPVEQLAAGVLWGSGLKLALQLLVRLAHRHLKAAPEKTASSDAGARAGGYV